MTPALELCGLRFAYGDRVVFSGLSFSVAAGERLAILGANGAGKSTLLWCAIGLLRARGVRVFGCPPGPAVRARIGLVFQNPEDQLFMPSIVQDLSLPLERTGVPQDVARSRARAALQEFGLEQEAERPASDLSLGQRKRAAIALAMVRRPEILMLDEPTAELDGRAVRLLTASLGRIAATQIVASHHLEFVGAVAERVIVLHDGRIMRDGPAAGVLRDTCLLEAAGLI